ELRVERDVAEPAGNDSAVEPLVPVVEPVATVVRDLEEHLLDRLGRDHLATGRDDESLELAEESARVSVSGDHDRVGEDVVERRNARVLVDLDTGPGGTLGDAANELGRLQNAVGRMEERSRIALQWSCQLLAPLGREAGRPQRLVLVP